MANPTLPEDEEDAPTAPPGPTPRPTLVPTASEPSADVVFEDLWTRWWSTRQGAAELRAELDKGPSTLLMSEACGALAAMLDRAWRAQVLRMFPEIADDDPLMNDPRSAAARVAALGAGHDDLYRRRLAAVLARSAAHGGPAAAVRAAQDAWTTAPGTQAESALAPIRVVNDVLQAHAACPPDELLAVAAVVTALESAVPVLLRAAALAQSDPSEATDAVEGVASEIGWCVESDLLTFLYGRVAA